MIGQSVVYFAESAERPGQIKIGYTTRPAARQSVGRFKFCATIPGTGARESALHWAHRRFRVDGEWFAASAVRQTMAAIRDGDLPWLDAEPTGRTPLGSLLVTEAAEWFGGVNEAAQALGYASGASFRCASRNNWLPSVVWGRMAVVRAGRDGRLPAHLSLQPGAQTAAAERSGRGVAPPLAAPGRSTPFPGASHE